jgi:uncharacterized protein (TIGR03032 family)
MPETPSPPPADEPWLEVYGSRHFPAWMAEHRVSLAATTYQAGKLFLIGLQPDGRLAVFERTFNRCMGLWADDQTLWMGSPYPRCGLHVIDRRDGALAAPGRRWSANCTTR